MAIEKKIKVTIDASEARRQIKTLKDQLSDASSGFSKFKDSARQAGQESKKFSNSAKNSASALLALVPQLRAAAVAAIAWKGVKLADDFNELQNKIRITTESLQEFNLAQETLVDISLRTRSSLRENGLLYLRLAQNTDRAKVSQEELFRIAETVNKAVQIGGSSAQEAAGALRQFTQIIASGFSSGFSQEINSIAEQTPGLFKIIENGLRNTSEEFRELEASGLSGIKILKTFSEEGIGDLDTLLAAIADQAEEVDKQFGNVNVTVQKALRNVGTAVEAALGRIDDQVKATDSLAKAINSVAIGINDAFTETRKFGEIYATVFEVLVAATQVAVEDISSVFSLLPQAIGGSLDGIFQGVKKLTNSIPEGFKNGLTIALNSIRSFVNVVARIIFVLSKTIESTISKAFESIKAIISSTITGFGQLPQAIALLSKGELGKAGELLAESFGDGFKSQLSSESLFDEIELAVAQSKEFDFVGNLFGFAADQGEALVGGIRAGVGNAIEFVGDSIDNFFDRVLARVQQNKGIPAIIDFTIGSPKQQEEAKGFFAEFLAEAEKFADKFLDIINASADSFTAFTDLFSTLSEIRQDKLDEELKNNKDLTDKERRIKEKAARDEFNLQKGLSLASIAVNTGAAIINALATAPDPITGSLLASAAAATGAAQYAKVSATSYEAPSAPKSSGFSVPSAATQSQQNINIQVTGNNFGNDQNAGQNVVQAIKDAISDGEIIFDRNSDQFYAIQG